MELSRQKSVSKKLMKTKEKNSSDKIFSLKQC